VSASPVARVWRPVRPARVAVRLPYSRYNRDWFKEVLGPRVRPDWNGAEKQWELARLHFRAIVEALAQRFGVVQVTVDFAATSRCDTRCRDAEGDECDCQCYGENHGGAAYWKNWQEVGETTLIASEGIYRKKMRVHATEIPPRGR